jgi:hypothetical protein
VTKHGLLRNFVAFLRWLDALVLLRERVLAVDAGVLGSVGDIVLGVGRVRWCLSDVCRGSTRDAVVADVAPVSDRHLVVLLAGRCAMIQTVQLLPRIWGLGHTFILAGLERCGHASARSISSCCFDMCG